MYLSRSNGLLNSDVLPMKDTLVNVNTLNDLTLHMYTKEEIEYINALKKRRVS